MTENMKHNLEVAVGAVSLALFAAAMMLAVASVQPVAEVIR